MAPGERVRPGSQGAAPGGEGPSRDALVAMLRTAGNAGLAARLPAGEPTAWRARDGAVCGAVLDGLLATASGDALDAAVHLASVWHRADPQEIRWQGALIEAALKSGRPGDALAALVPNSVTVRHYTAHEGTLARLFVAIGEAGADAAGAAVRFLTTTAADAGTRVALLLALEPATLSRLSNGLADGSWAVPDPVLVRFADELSIAGLAEAAAPILASVLRRVGRDFHLSLLACRIAVQRQDRRALDDHFGVCEGAVAADRSLAEHAPLFDAVALLAAPDDEVQALRARRMAARIDGRADKGTADKGTSNKATAEVVFHFWLSAGRLGELGPALATLATHCREATTAALARAFLPEGSMPSSEAPALAPGAGPAVPPSLGPALALLSSGGHAYPRVIAALLERAVPSDASPAVAEAVLDSLDLTHPPTKNVLRQRASALQAAGYGTLAHAISGRLARRWPKDVWLRIHAIEAAHGAGQGDAARALAADLPLSDVRGELLADVAQVHAKIGLFDEAARLFRTADRALVGAAVSARVAKVMARGLMLTGAREAPAGDGTGRAAGGAREGIAAALRWADRAFPPPEPLMGAPAGWQGVILDPGYTPKAGHHTNNGLFWSDLLEQHTGRAPTIVVHRTAQANALSDRPLARSFAFEPYAPNAFPLDEATILSLNEAFAADLAEIFGGRRARVMAIHSMRFVMLEGLLAWLAHTPRQAPTLAIIDLVEADLLATTPLHGLAARVAAWDHAIAGRDDLSLLVMGESDAGAAWLARAFPTQRVEKLPFVAAGAARRVRQRELRRVPTFGVLGATRPERGLGTFARAIAGYGGAARFSAQVDLAELATFDPAGAALTRTLAASNALRLVEGVLSRDAYYHELGALDALVLPYTGRYRVSGSGVLFEAMAALRYVIAPRHSTLADELAAQDYPHTLVDAAVPASVAAAMADAEARWPAIRDALAAFGRRRSELPSDRFERRLRESLSRDQLDPARRAR